MRSTKLPIFIHLLGAAWLCWAPVAHAQVPSAPANLAAGINQVRAGDFFTALFTLNQVVRQTSERREDAAILARAHAFRAMAYEGLNQPDRAKAAVTLALEADPNVVVSPSEFSTRMIALFDAARRPLPADPEAAGQALEQAGRFQQAFQSYLKAYQSLPDPAPTADDQRLREQIIRVVPRLETPPAITAASRAHVAKADQLVEAEAILGSSSGTSSIAAATELRQAVRSSPWWPEATLKLATVLQKLQRVDEALLNLTLYKLAVPGGSPGMPAVKKEDVTGTIHIFRRHGGGSRRIKVECDGVTVADLQNDRSVTLTAAPGTHYVDVGGDRLALEVAGGQDHYVRLAVSFTSGWTVRAVSAEAARAEIAERTIGPADANRIYSTGCAQKATARK